MTDPADDFAAVMSGLLPGRPVDPDPAGEPVPADVVDELRRLDADFARTGQLPDWMAEGADQEGAPPVDLEVVDPSTGPESGDPEPPAAPRRPRPDPSQGSGSFGSTPTDPADTFAAIVRGRVPGYPAVY